MKKTYLVTGGAGFIGSNFVELALSKLEEARIVVLDALTYSGRRQNLEEFTGNSRFAFEVGNILDFELIESLFLKYKFDGVFHFAAESHVDNSIERPDIFVKTNVLGTFNLLEVARRNWLNKESSSESRKNRFLHVSTDEVYGALGSEGSFTELSPYSPNSPYSASKAASDHFVRAYFKTYGLNTVTTNCSNNYGPKQFPEKLIPLVISKALAGNKIPVYGTGSNVRDWIHVEDHCRGILTAFSNGKSGETYCFGGGQELSNLEVVKKICEILDRIEPLNKGKSYLDQISFVTDRLGHDFRYSIDDTKAKKELQFDPIFKDFVIGLEDTVKWYVQKN